MDTLTELLSLEVVIGSVIEHLPEVEGIMPAALRKEVFLSGDDSNAYGVVFSVEGFGPEVLHRAFDPQSGAIGFGLTEVEAVQNMIVDYAFACNDEWVMHGPEPLPEIVIDGDTVHVGGVSYPLTLRIGDGFGPEMYYQAHLETPRAFDGSPTEGYTGFGYTPEEAVQAAYHGNHAFTSYPQGPCAFEWEWHLKGCPDEMPF